MIITIIILGPMFVKRLRESAQDYEVEKGKLLKINRGKKSRSSENLNVNRKLIKLKLLRPNQMILILYMVIILKINCSIL